MQNCTLYVYAMPMQPLSIQLETDSKELFSYHFNYCDLKQTIDNIKTEFNIRSIYINDNQYSSIVRQALEDMCGIEVKELLVND